MRLSSQFIIGIILARLLGPEAFGIVAVGWLMVGIGNLVADFGLSAAVIQSKTLVEKDIRFAFTTQVIFGATLTLIGYLSAKPVAVFLHHADAVPIIQAMAFLFLLQSFGQTAGALLRRSLNFKAYQAINIASYLTGYLFGWNTLRLLWLRCMEPGGSTIGAIVDVFAGGDVAYKAINRAGL